MEQLLEFITNHPLLVTAAIVTATILIFNELRVAGTGKYSVSPDQAVRLMNQGAVVVDIRKPEDYKAGHLAGAKNMPLADLDGQIESLKRYRGKPLITYCDRGLSTTRAIAKFRAAEFEHVFSLRGGLTAWREEHLPVEKSKGKS